MCKTFTSRSNPIRTALKAKVKAFNSLTQTSNDSGGQEVLLSNQDEIKKDFKKLRYEMQMMARKVQQLSVRQMATIPLNQVITCISQY